MNSVDLNKKAIDPTDYADPLFGVGGATSAGPTLPSGSIHPSPETLGTMTFILATALNPVLTAPIISTR